VRAIARYAVRLVTAQWKCKMSTNLIRTACPSCSTKIGVRPDQVGRRIRCPKCRAAFSISAPAEPSQPDPATPPAQQPEPESFAWSPAEDANELAAFHRREQVWHRAKMSSHYDRPRDLVFQAAVQAVRTARCDLAQLDWANAYVRFSFSVTAGQPTTHDLFAIQNPMGGSDVEVTSQEPNVEGMFDPHYAALFTELKKYLLFAPPAPPAPEPLPLPPPEHWSPPVRRRRTRRETGPSGLGIAGFVCGLVGSLLFCIPLFAWILGILGVVFGGIAMSQRRDGFGIAGLVLGIISVSLGFLAFLFFLAR
jgi:hypothetical protein